MRDFLAKRPIRGVFVDRIFVARRVRSVVGRLNRGTGDKSLRQCRDAHGLWPVGTLRNMDVSLNDQGLNRHSKKREQQERYAGARRSTSNDSAGALAGDTPSGVAVLHHPLPVRFSSRLRMEITLKTIFFPAPAQFTACSISSALQG